MSIAFHLEPSSADEVGNLDMNCGKEEHVRVLKIETNIQTLICQNSIQLTSNALDLPLIKQLDVVSLGWCAIANTKLQETE